VKVARFYVEEASSPSVSAASIDAATEVLSLLISRRCTYSEASNQCQIHINSDRPARQIQSILNIADGVGSDPPPIPRHLTKRCRLWAPGDDVRLLAGLVKYGVGDWKNIAEFVGNGKTGSQCSQRWTRALNPELSKDQWTEEEDGDLWDGVQTHGQHSWARVAKHVRSRSDVQCRYRYDQLKRMKKFRGNQKVVDVPVRLIEDPFDFAMAELMPPLIDRKHTERIKFQDG
jgi:hypothetical protein